MKKIVTKRNNMEIIQKMIASQNYFPGNPYYPLLIYKKALADMNESLEAIQDRLTQNNWRDSWLGRIYDFHHYHSKTHEVLVIISGDCQVQFGGDHGLIDTVDQDDVVIIPAGVAHKSLKTSNNFQCIGAYPLDVGCGINYGTVEEYPEAIEMIQQVKLPLKDPIFGINGLLFNYWK
jgi:uncharacterized protein YjlB